MGKLKLKVTERCDANCACCTSRLSAYDQKRQSSMTVDMDIDLARRCIDNAVGLGWNDVVISGGEPLLLDYLEEIISYANINNMNTKLYTNGGNLSGERASRY